MLKHRSWRTLAGTHTDQILKNSVRLHRTLFSVFSRYSSPPRSSTNDVSAFLKYLGLFCYMRPHVGRHSYNSRVAPKSPRKLPEPYLISTGGRGSPSLSAPTADISARSRILCFLAGFGPVWAGFGKLLAGFGWFLVGFGPESSAPRGGYKPKGRPSRSPLGPFEDGRLPRRWGCIAMHQGRCERRGT
jgi:hypothetical protein